MGSTATSPDAVTQAMIAAEKTLDKAYNDKVVSLYNSAVANYNSNLGSWKALGLPIPNYPDAPYLRITNVDAIIAVESQPPNQPNQPDFYSLVKYVPVPVNPIPTPTALTINEATVEYPGIYEANGDSPDIPVGASFDQNGHTYKKIVISSSPFAPGGVVTGWQQIL